MTRIQHSAGRCRLDMAPALFTVRDVFDEVVAIVPLNGGEHAELQRMADGLTLATGPELLRVVETTLELHAAGTIKLPGCLLRDALLAQQTARGGL